MFYLKNKVFQHVAEMLKLQTFHSNWTARACNFSKEIRSSWVTTKKKDYWSSAIANHAKNYIYGIPVKAVCKGRLQWGFLAVYKFEYDPPIHWEPIPDTALP